jgi:peptidyl-prolyl cis-trans isomerase B (cyclophilin B)
MKKLMVLSLLFFLTACATPTEEAVQVEETITYTIDTASLNVPYASYFKDTNPWIVIEFENNDYDPIVLELFPEVAPITVEQITSLVARNFYDGIIFHRVIEDFMIQGGDPTGTGGGGANNNITGEFNENNIANRLRHWRGVMSMARAQDPNSASSQFFIVHQDANFLDGDYAGFGGVIQGFETLDAIATTPTDANDRPLQDVVMRRVRLVNR